MFKVIVTSAVISKGYAGASAIRFNSSEKGEVVRFRIGKQVYDPKAEDGSRWLNLNVKGFGPICNRIQKMQLKENSVVNLIGRLDEESWTDQETGETKTKTVIVLDEIEYAWISKKDSNTNAQQDTAPTNAAPANAAPVNAAPANVPSSNPPVNAAQTTSQPANTPPMQANSAPSENFTGYEPFGGNSFFDLT